jgi:hypothetical protein
MSDRKYRHRGYQDDDRDRDRDRDRGQRSRGPSGPRPSRLDGAPRGRGVGLPTAVTFKCAACGQEIKRLSTFEPTDRCPGCSKPLHSCVNCAFFDTSARFECKKTIPARLDSKTKANECEHFQPKTVRDLRSQTPSTPTDARSAFDALFKK